jgi:predicted enzyme related to lactoylglutathione lyase
MITGTDFVTVPTEDLDAAVAFYGDTLGLHRSVHMPERGFAEFETGNLTLSVIMPSKMGMERYVSNNTIALRVDDMEDARARLEASGVTFAGDTMDTGVCHMAFFRDPHGNPLMLHHRYTPRETE